MSRGRNLPIRLSVEDAEKAVSALRKFGVEGERALDKIVKKGDNKPGKGLMAVDAGVKEVKGNLTQLAGTAGVAGAALTALGPAGIAAAAALAVISLGAGKLFQASKEAVNALSEIKAEAELAGTGAEAFQELSFAATQSKVSQEALADGLKELKLRADEFIETSKGPGAEAFARLGYSQEELAEGLKQSDKLFEDVIHRMEGLDNAAQLRISDEIFGGQAGEQFVRFLEKGADEIRRMRQEARDMGLVIDEHLIRNADESRKKMELMSKVVSTQMNTALANLAPIIVTAAEAFADLAKWIGKVVDGFVALESKSTQGVMNEIAAIQKQLDEVDQRIGQERGGFNVHKGLEIRDLELERARIVEQLNAAKKELERRQALKEANSPSGTGGSGVNVPTLDKVKTVMKDLDSKILSLQKSKEEFEILSAIDRAGVKPGSADAEAITAKIQQLQQLRTEQENLNNLNKAQIELEKEVAETIETSLEAVKERKKSLDGLIESETFRMEISRAQAAGDKERVAVLQSLAQAEARVGELTKDEAAALEDVVRQRVRLDDAIEKTREKTEQAKATAKEFGDSFGSAFEDAIVGAKSFGDAMKGLLEDVARMLIRQTITQPIGNFFSSSLKSIFAFENGGIMTSAGPLPLRTYSRGGIANSPQLAMFGEGSVPEAYVPVPSGRIPVVLKGLGGGGGNTFQVIQHNNFSGNGAGGQDGGQEAFAEQMAKAAADSMRQIAREEIRMSQKVGGSANPINRLY